MENTFKLLALSQIKGIGKKTLNKISEMDIRSAQSQKDLYDIYLSIKTSRVENISIDDFAKYTDKAKNILDECNVNNIICFSKFDNAYPEKFLDLDTPPAIMYAKGNVSSLKQNGIGIIGTREISQYGIKIGERFGEVVAESGNTVISGLALGCDTAGHIGCLKVPGGITIAILPTPLDQIYPKQNEHLADKILSQKGCIISEYALGSIITKSNFVERDRLQYGLANGIIVVETGETGGSYYAINGALKQKKPVGCFNYSEAHYNNNIHSIGNRNLISTGKAYPLYDLNTIQSFIEKCNNVRKDMKESNSLF